MKKDKGPEDEQEIAIDNPENTKPEGYPWGFVVVSQGFGDQAQDGPTDLEVVDGESN